MATKKEKIIGSLFGAIIGGAIANRDEYPEKDNLKEIIKGILVGGTCGYGFSCLFGSPNDTINYTHFHKGKRVYEGITYTDRFHKRMAEHRINGKVFSRVVKDTPKPRIEALKLERERIKKYKPINNIQYNQ